MGVRTRHGIDLEADGCEHSLLEAFAALGVVTSRFFARCWWRLPMLNGGSPPYY